MKVCALQFDIAWENKAANFERVRELLDASPPEKKSLVVLPELFATGFSMNTATIAEPQIFTLNCSPRLSDCAKAARSWGICSRSLRLTTSTGECM